MTRFHGTVLPNLKVCSSLNVLTEQGENDNTENDSPGLPTKD